jgi:hypothetical protein
MKVVAVIVQMFLLLLCGAGCGPAGTGLSPKAGNGSNRLSESSTGCLKAYGPVKVDIMPLTEFTRVDNSKIIKAYVSLLDSFDCQIKTPVIFRFELYDKVPRSAEPKGRRIILWPDIDLNDAAKNNEYWKDFLRAYEFDLPFEPKGGKSYILQVTSLCPDGRRLSAEFTLKRTH